MRICLVARAGLELVTFRSQSRRFPTTPHMSTIIIIIINNNDTIIIQIDDNSIVNDMLFRELILLFLHE